MAFTEFCIRLSNETCTFPHQSKYECIPVTFLRKEHQAYWLNVQLMPVYTFLSRFGAYKILNSDFVYENSALSLMRVMFVTVAKNQPWGLSCETNTAAPFNCFFRLDTLQSCRLPLFLYPRPHPGRQHFISQLWARLPATQPPSLPSFPLRSLPSFPPPNFLPISRKRSWLLASSGGSVVMLFSFRRYGRGFPTWKPGEKKGGRERKRGGIQELWGEGGKGSRRGHERDGSAGKKGAPGAKKDAGGNVCPYLLFVEQHDLQWQLEKRGESCTIFPSK